MPSDFDALVGRARGWNRRGFVQGSAGLGFAAAALPVVADTTIRTSAEGLLAGRVEIPAGGLSSVPAYRAAPAGAKRPPTVLVASEIFGLHEHIADVCRRLAQAGWMAIAPDLFQRQGDATAIPEVARLIAEVVSKVPDEQVMQDLDACVDWAAGQGADTGRLGITGFCWGGRIVWLYSARQPRLRAGVAWYGRLEGSTTALQPRHPIDVVGELKAPVLGLYGGQDAGIPPESVERMKKALAAGSPAARRSQFVVYPDAPHAFHADYRPSWRQPAAEDGWQRCLAWLRANGAG